MVRREKKGRRRQQREEGDEGRGKMKTDERKGRRGGDVEEEGRRGRERRW